MHKGTSLGLRQLVLLLPVLILALAFGQGTASAANRAGCTPSPPLGSTDPNAPCDSASASASTTFDINGQLVATNVGAVTGLPLGGCDPALTGPCVPGTNVTNCPSASVDTANVTCEHFVFAAKVAGTLQVCVPFDPGTGLNEVDVFIVDQATGRIVGTPGNTGANPACASAAVSAGQTLEILIDPAFIETPISFTGTVTFTANPIVVRSACYMYYGHHAEGRGEDDHHGRFHGEGHRDDARGEKEGHAQYKNDYQGYNFHSTRTDDVTFTQIGTAPNGNPIMQMVMTGAGVNNGQAVTYTITMISGGLDNGTGDSFLITTSDGKSGGGQVTNGSNHYRHYQD